MKNPHEICGACGLSHLPTDRQRTIARMMPCDTEDVYQMFPCFYGIGLHEDPSGYQRLMRDLREVRNKYGERYPGWEKVRGMRQLQRTREGAEVRP